MFPLRSLLSREVEEHGGKRKPQMHLGFFLSQAHANGHKQPEPVCEDKL